MTFLMSLPLRNKIALRDIDLSGTQPLIALQSDLDILNR